MANDELTPQEKKVLAKMLEKPQIVRYTDVRDIAKIRQRAKQEATAYIQSKKFQSSPSAQRIIDTSQGYEKPRYTQAEQEQAKKKSLMARMKPYVGRYGYLPEPELSAMEQGTEAAKAQAKAKRIEAIKYADRRQTSKLGKVFRGIQQFGTPAATKSYYFPEQSQPNYYGSVGGKKKKGQNEGSTLKGMRTGKPGRPKGTLALINAKYGGVYERRKAESHQRALEKIRMRQQMQNPQNMSMNMPMPMEQKQYMQFLARQQEMRKMAVESNEIPDTFGEINMKKIFKDIEDATGLVD